jgi:hypothetical protein
MTRHEGRPHWLMIVANALTNDSNSMDRRLLVPI